MRDGLAMVARDVDGELVVENNPLAGCYDFDNGPNATQQRAAYKAFVRWMVDFFDPQYLSHVIEMNIYDANCPDQYASVLSLANEVYEQEKAVNPDLPIFATFAISFMWGYDTGECAIGDRACLELNLTRIAGLERDRFAISSYPAFLSNESPQIPDDFFDAVHEITGERLVWGETGYGNRDVTIPYPTLDDPCQTILFSSDQEQIDYLNFLLEDANRMGSDLVVWWSFRDFITPEVLSSCPCSAPGLWCVLYEAMYNVGLLPAWLHWGAMGMLDYAVQPKPALATWNDWLARPVEPAGD
jgi:hypothetical protein